MQIRSDMHAPVTHVPHPNQPLPPVKRRELRDVVMRRAGAYLDRCGMNGVDADGRLEIRAAGLSRAELRDLQEGLVKHVARKLNVEQIGGAGVTRLDRVLDVDHPRLSRREAVELLERRGYGFERRLPRAAATVLTDWCGGLPVHVADDADGEAYVLPYAGECSRSTADGAVSVDVARLLQFLMGLERKEDALPPS